MFCQYKDCANLSHVIPVDIHGYQSENIVSQFAGVNRYPLKQPSIKKYTIDKNYKCNKIYFSPEKVPMTNSKNNYTNQKKVR